MLDIYAEVAETEAAMPVVRGRKSEAEKFAGAFQSFTIEAMMGDTRALQSATSHNLGQNFARAFDIRYLDAQNQQQYCWTTSWGFSTRFVGAIIMVHGDDQGLIFPPRLAPHQILLVPIHKDEAERTLVSEAVERLRRQLQEFRVRVDDREGLTPGYKFHDGELRGVPLRIEVGPKDVAKGTVALARRDRPGKEGRSFVPQEGLERAAADLLDDIQAALYQRALAFRQENTRRPTTYDDFRQAVEVGWAEAWWCGEAECEAAIQKDTHATTRCIPFDQPGGSGRCVRCGKPAAEVAVFARAY
jgi:prolyl-tRNA synthetase